ncbi:hypothetical protein [Vibrio hangzhouensis]|uniref:hypothetical protein n=1 Tax=Vibrio hangzhouensis TaxID=462991 RepID=UPI001C937ACB|nr:hypothetical protein [Vibrio hangzhouensis]MBY6198179.1 hypothetical protein [Vibrio hangzhouensis]
MEILLALSALVIACITLFVQRQHNRKELLPILNTEYEETHKTGDHLYQLWLINNGHGVALIKEYHFVLPSGESVMLDDEHNFLKIIEQNVPNRKSMSNSLPKSLASNDKALLYSFSVPALGRNALAGTTVKVVAESVYGDEVIVDKEGFTVISNRRDAQFEIALKRIADIMGKLLQNRA